MRPCEEQGAAAAGATATRAEALPASGGGDTGRGAAAIGPADMIEASVRSMPASVVGCERSSMPTPGIRPSERKGSGPAAGADVAAPAPSASASRLRSSSVWPGLVAAAIEADADPSMAVCPAAGKRPSAGAGLCSGASCDGGAGRSSATGRSLGTPAGGMPEAGAAAVPGSMRPSVDEVAAANCVAAAGAEMVTMVPSDASTPPEGAAAPAPSWDLCGIRPAPIGGCG
mmetsp:Transcript_18208/g.52599  ORF Transcript_18208/g.52599 Transcript_18208/m.52599 type:complete len:229 (+) Transcript_18208:207-893(+)